MIDCTRQTTIVDESTLFWWPCCRNTRWIFLASVCCWYFQSFAAAPITPLRQFCWRCSCFLAYICMIVASCTPLHGDDIGEREEEISVVANKGSPCTTKYHGRCLDSNQPLHNLLACILASPRSLNFFTPWCGRPPSSRTPESSSHPDRWFPNNLLNGVADFYSNCLSNVLFLRFANSISSRFIKWHMDLSSDSMCSMCVACCQFMDRREFGFNQFF